MLIAALAASIASAAATPQFSFTIWDWEPAYRDLAFFQRQVDTVAGHGVNNIELGVSWRDCEPRDNQFDFTVPDARVAYVQAKGLALRLRVNMTDWPDWSAPERFQNPDGSVFAYGRGLPSVFNANNRARQHRFAAALAQHYSGRCFTYTPAFSVHMEVKFGGWNTYEPSARAGFQNWLAGRYGTITALNNEMSTAYESFTDIAPQAPRYPADGPSTGPLAAEWVRYREAVLTDWVAAFAAAVRAHDATARVSVPLGESFRRESAEFANLAYWNFSRPADEVVHSYDFFMHGRDHVEDIGLATAIMTGITQRPTVVEIDGPILIEKFGYDTGGLVAAAKHALAHGAAGVQVTNWGSGSPEALAWLGAVGEEVRAPREPAAHEGLPILYYVSKWQNYSVGAAHRNLFEEQFGALRTLRDANAHVRVITDENLLYEDLRGAAMLVPCADTMDNAAREKLRAVSMGIRVFAGTKPGVYTPTAKTDGNFGAKIEVVDPASLVALLNAPRDPHVPLRAAAVQFHTSFNVDSNAGEIVRWTGKAAAAGARVVVFSEMALTGYTKKREFRDTLDWETIDKAIETIAAACKKHDVYAIVGAPTRDGDNVFCAALAIDPQGAIIDRYEKTYLAGERWATPGRRLTAFAIDGVKCGTIVCHDERYPHLVQLRALAGAQLFFYISCESGLGEEHKIGPYRAQLQARAVENGVYVVHANAPARRGDHGAEGTSNGHSRIIGPDGNLIAEAGPYDESMVIADIDLRHASEAGRPAALETGPASRWLRKGVRLVQGE